MPVESHFPLSHSNQYGAESACGHCDGVIRHQPLMTLQTVTLAHRKGYRANPLAGVPYTTNLQSFPCAARGETHPFHEHLEQSVA
jgi:hypothetical protein